MLDNLVESRKNSAENKRLGRCLLTTFVLVFTLFISGVLWSLFGKDFGISGTDFELSTLVTPLLIEENKPEPELIERREKSAPNQITVETTRQINMPRTDESPIVPKGVSVVQNTVKARPTGKFIVREGSETDAPAVSYERGNQTNNSASFGGQNQTAPPEKSEIIVPKPPPPIKKPTEESKKLPTISGGVVNGKAVSLPKPAYPQTARAVGASGKVDVQVLIDETGKVVSARAIGGHPLLRDAAEQAARSAKFSPTYLTDKPVKVSGLIVYNFTKN